MIYCIATRRFNSNAIIDRVQNLEFKEKLRIHLQKMCGTNVLQIDTNISNLNVSFQRSSKRYCKNT